jgi:hypothetical protein
MVTNKDGKRGIEEASLAKHLDLTVRRVRQLVSEGILPRRANGTFHQDKCRTIYIRYLRAEGRRSKDSDAKTRAQEARTKRIEMQVRREEGETVDLAETEVIFEDVLGTYRAELAGVPASCTRDLGLREIMEGKLNDAIGRCKRRFLEKGAALRGGGEIFVDDEAADA